jgi:hypothetical protein
MLPKPEKKRKTKSDIQQLDLVDTVSSAQKIKTKRATLLWALLFTFGLSLIFSIYQSLSSRQFSFSLPQFNLPTNISLLPTKTSSLDSELSQLFSSTPQLNFYLRTQNADSTTYSFSQNIDQLFLDQNYQQLISELSSTPATSDSPLAKLLPQGVELRQVITTKEDFLEAQYLINIPKKQIFIIFSGPRNQTQLVSEEKFAQLIEKIYFLILNQSTQI